MNRHSEIEQFLQAEIDVGSFPSAVYAAGSSRGIDLEGALGNAVSVPFRLPATKETIYDCASLTKPLITTTLVMQAVAEGRIRLDDEFEGFPYRRLLTHTSGLMAWLPLYSFDDYLRAIKEKGMEYEPGKRVVYSDLNFILLHYALKRIYGDYVARAKEKIFEPLGLTDAMFHPPASLRPRIAATEWGQRYEYGMCATRNVSFKGFRRGLIWGETHDGNSHHHGGTAGNAGL
ncbi:MAG TPA: serine hydrolase domain-containing protein, partial [Thermoanaerobaculia bacterium]